MNNLKHKNNTGFSLAELSIVLIIIGLLVTGVSASSKLVNSATLSKIIRDINAINMAYLNFTNTYNNIPGDFVDAPQYWTGTNNGGGNGLTQTTAGITAANSQGDEVANVFSHLYASEFLAAQDNSVVISQGDYGYDIGFDAKGLIVYEKHSNGVTHGGFISDLTNKHLLLFGLNVSVVTRAATAGVPGVSGAFLTPGNAYKIDKKLDDALPDSGKVSYRDETGASEGNVTPATCKNTTPTPDEYKLSSSSKGCNLVYELDQG